MCSRLFARFSFRSESSNHPEGTIWVKITLFAFACLVSEPLKHVRLPPEIAKS